MPRKCLFALAALAPACALAVVFIGCPHRPQAVPGTPQELRDELARAGVEYEARPAFGGLLLKASALPWQEAEDAMNGGVPLNRLPAGVLLALPCDPRKFAPDPAPDRLLLPGLIVRGAPGELAKVRAALTR